MADIFSDDNTDYEQEYEDAKKKCENKSYVAYVEERTNKAIIKLNNKRDEELKELQEKYAINSLECQLKEIEFLDRADTIFKKAIIYLKGSVP